MSEKHFYGTVIPVALKPWTGDPWDTNWGHEMRGPNLDQTEDLAIALGKIHSWYANFSRWVFGTPTFWHIPGSSEPSPVGSYSEYAINHISTATEWDIELYSEDYPGIQVGDLIMHQKTFALATHAHTGIDGYNIDYDMNWTIDSTINECIPEYTNLSNNDYLSEYYSAGSSNWSSDPTNLVHPLVGIHMLATNKGACAHGELMLLGDNDHVFFRSSLGFRGWTGDVTWDTFNQNWHACIRATDITCSDSSMTLTPINYNLHWSGEELVDGKKQSAIWSKQVPVGITISHTNSVTAQATSGMYKFTYDANGHITGSTAVVKADITALGIPGSNTDTKVTQNVTSTSSIYPLLLSYYTTSSSTTTAQTVNRSNNLAFNPSAGEILLYRKGSYITTTDSSDTLFGLICYNGSNMWIGSNQSATHHHTGATYISTGYNTSTNTGNPTFYAAVPNATNTGSTNYDVLHQGNTYFQTSSNAATWEALGITKSGYAFYVFRGDTVNKTPPYCAGYYAPGLMFGYGDTKGFISTSYDAAKVSFGGGQRTNSDPATKAPTWYFSLTGTTATTYNLDNFALASDYLPLAGGTMDSGATITIYTDQAETQGIQYVSTGQRFKIASGVGWTRSVMAYKGAFSGDVLGAYGMYGAADSFTNNRMNYFYIGKTYNDQWYEFGYGKFSVVDNDLNGWMLRYRYPWTASGTSGTYEGSFISLYPYDRYGYCLCVGENSGGLTIVGAGEAAQQLRTTVTNASTTPYGSAMSYGTESLMLGADTDLYFVSGANTLTASAHTEGTNLKTFIWSNAGSLRPWNDDTYSIGASTKRWNYGYFTNISGKLIGTIDSTTTGVTQGMMSPVDSSTKIATTQFAWRLKHRAGTFYINPTGWSSAPWGKVANIKYSSTGNLYLTTVFLITSNYKSTTARPGMGILFVQFYVTNERAVNYTIKWLYSDDAINNDTVAITYTADTSTSTHFSDISVWVKCDAARYQSISVAEIHEMNLSSYVGSSTWNMYTLTAGVAALPSDSATERWTTNEANVDQPLLYTSSAATTYVECSISELFLKWKAIYVCVQNSTFKSGSSQTNATNYNFVVPLQYVKNNSRYGQSGDPGYYAGEGFNPSNTGASSSAVRMLVQWVNDGKIRFTHQTDGNVGVIRIYGLY